MEICVNTGLGTWYCRGHIITSQQFSFAPSASVMIAQTTVGKGPVILPATCPFLMWNLDPPEASHTLACAHMLVYCGVRLSTKIIECSSESVCLPSCLFFFSSGCCEERRLSHMSVLFWLCCSWSCWAPFFLSLWSPLRGLRTPTTYHQRHCSTTAGSPCSQSMYPISSTTTRKWPSNAAWTHFALLK